MNRRAVLRALAGVGAATSLGALSPRELLALGRRLHARSGAPLAALTPSQAETVAAIADLILPVTDTPGARDVGVESFVDLLLAEWYTAAERDRFLAGLVELDERSRRLGGAVFTGLTAEQQGALLASLDGERGSREGAGYTFGRIKRHTLHAYFTSQVVVERVLGTPLIPGRFDGCAERSP
jgi:hypothetical protein